MKLADAMMRDGVTVEDVAATINHKPTTVARWISGEGCGFNLGQALRIKTAFFPHMTIEELF